MFSWVYVQAIVNCREIVGPGSIRFRHALVWATDEHEAYGKGQQEMDGFLPKQAWEVINDYVIMVGDSRGHLL